MKSDNAPCKIYADLESSFKKTDSFKNIPEKSSTTERGGYFSCGCSMSTIWVLDNTKNKSFYRYAKRCST